MRPGDPKLKSMTPKIPREEIDAIWSIIGFLSCCASTRHLCPNNKSVKNVLLMLSHYECGTLSKIEDQLPPTRAQIDACSREVKWASILLRSKMFGDLPDLKSFVKHLLERAVLLESFDAVLDLSPAAPATKVNKAVTQLWNHSCISASDVAPLQADLLNLGSSFVASDTKNVCSLLPSTPLLQQCISLVASYAGLTMREEKKWIELRNVRSTLADGFEKKALKLESMSDGGNQKSMDPFAQMFYSIEAATESQIVKSPASSHLREAVCYLMFAGIVARRSVGLGEGQFPRLCKAFREKVSQNDMMMVVLGTDKVDHILSPSHADMESFL